tara:strand:- start:1034 stop:1213 length:180 start_codon:yes stop_codon:yes gene_type:complete
MMSKERGYNYADKELKKGTDINLLYEKADNQFDFNDFDRGILDRLREQDNGEGNKAWWE